MATIAEIQTCINNLTTSTADELLLLAAQTNVLTADRIVKVATCANLPDLVTCSLSNGTVVFVENINTPVMSANGCWVGLDNRILRQDIAMAEVWAWGCNTFGQLGDGTVVSKTSPVSIVGGFTDWCQVSASSHSIGLRTNGTAWSWGCNSSGQLGDYTAVNKSSPVSVVGGFTDWSQVSAGSQHSLGVRTNGSAWAWGSNTCGQLGDYTSVAKSSPVSVVGGFTDWSQVSAGTSHSTGVRTDGTAWAWGSDSQGQLGDCLAGINQSSPVSVVGGFTDWVKVLASDCFSIGLRSNGTIWGWGSANETRTGQAFNQSSPAQVAGGLVDWCDIGVGQTHSFGIRTNGTLWAWGSGTGGALGDGTIVAKSSPVQVAGGFTDWCQASGGQCLSVGLRINGTAWTWGTGAGGGLGDGTTTNKSSPVQVAGRIDDWCQVSANRGINSMVALRKY